MLRCRPLFSKPTGLLAGGLFCFLMTAPPAPGELSLDDVFRGGRELEVVTLDELSGDDKRAADLLKEMRGALERGRYELVLRQTEVLKAWFERGAPEYGETLWLRARALEALDRPEDFRKTAAEYLSGPDFRGHGRRNWFLVHFARSLAHAGNTKVAAQTWQRLLEEGHEPGPDQALEGAAMLLRAGKAKAARELLRQPDRRATGSASGQREWLLLESLLVSDNGETPVPKPRSAPDSSAAAFNLRRALLLELRGELEATRAAYEKLAERRELLRERERKLLDARREALTEGNTP